jgi:AraC-like DNA-binding protein
MTGAISTATRLAFTTRDIPRPSRGRALHTLIDQGLLAVEPLTHHTPEVELVKWRLPGASILAGNFAGVRQNGEPGRESAADDLFYGINVTGAALARQHGRQITLNAGDAMVVDLRGGRFTVLRPTPNRLIGVRVPRRTVPVDSGQAGDAALRLVPAHTPALQLLTRYLRSVLDAPIPLSAELVDAFVAHLTELIAMSLRPAESDTRATATPTIRAARLSTIKADIGRHLTDSSFTAAAVAARHGISTRYLHRLFEADTRTFSQFVLDRRLDLAYRRLRDPRYAARTISSIANGAGFGDLSYFNRTFRRRYEVAPSQVRGPQHEVVAAPGQSVATGPPPCSSSSAPARSWSPSGARA